MEGVGEIGLGTILKTEKQAKRNSGKRNENFQFFFFYNPSRR
jgi:hypothetical protein